MRRARHAVVASLVITCTSCLATAPDVDCGPVALSECREAVAAALELVADPRVETIELREFRPCPDDHLGSCPLVLHDFGTTASLRMSDGTELLVNVVRPERGKPMLAMMQGVRDLTP